MAKERGGVGPRPPHGGGADRRLLTVPACRTRRGKAQSRSTSSARASSRPLFSRNAAPSPKFKGVPLAVGRPTATAPPRSCPMAGAQRSALAGGDAVKS